MDIQLSKTQSALMWKVFTAFLGTPVFKRDASSDMSLTSRGLLSVDTLGDLVLVDKMLEAAALMGFPQNTIDQIKAKVDREVKSLVSKNKNLAA
jgi:hypothetical protein